MYVCSVCMYVCAYFHTIGILLDDFLKFIVDFSNDLLLQKTNFLLKVISLFGEL